MIELDKEKETMLIPLYGKAVDYESDASILKDKKAYDIVQAIDYPFKKLKIQAKTNTMLSLRAKLMDDYVSSFLTREKDCIVLHLGCGLDSRCVRINDSSVLWYDVDFEEVIEVRRNFFEESENYHMIGSSVTEEEWLKKMPETDKECLVVAEGLFMYHGEEELISLLRRIKDRLGGFTLVLDAYSTLTAKQAKNHPSLKRTGAVIKWGIDDPKEMSSWFDGIEFLEEQYFSDNRYIRELGRGTRLMYGIANRFEAARRAHRLLIYKIK